MSKRYTQQTCPKSDTWFAEGGRCGWAHCCAECDHLGQAFVPGLDSDGSDPTGKSGGLDVRMVAAMGRRRES